MQILFFNQIYSLCCLLFLIALLLYYPVVHNSVFLLTCFEFRHKRAFLHVWLETLVRTQDWKLGCTHHAPPRHHLICRITGLCLVLSSRCGAPVRLLTWKQLCLHTGARLPSQTRPPHDLFNHHSSFKFPVSWPDSTMISWSSDLEERLRKGDCELCEFATGLQHLGQCGPEQALSGSVDDGWMNGREEGRTVEGGWVSRWMNDRWIN
jgi:hypothetical protein